MQHTYRAPDFSEEQFKTAPGACVVGDDDSLRPLTTIAVDSSEFVVSKLRDRGTHQAFGVITNAREFLHVLRCFVEQHADEHDARTTEIRL
jgi:hypothetical protein